MRVRIEGLRQRYAEHEALKGIDLELGEGVTGLLGPNGAGKSTLLRILATLLQPTAGRVRVGEHELPRDQHQVRRVLGYLPQDFGVPGNLSGREYLHYAAAMKGAPTEEAERLLASVDLADDAHRRAGGYSGGMKQRLGVAQALLADPQLLLVDEPTAGLDPAQRMRFRHLLTEHREGRVTLFSTHVVADLVQTADRVVVIDRGKVRFSGTMDGLAQEAAGRVWEVRAAEGREPAQHAAVMSERREGGDLVMRVVAEEPPDGAVPAQPAVEDGYLAVVTRPTTRVCP